MPCKALHVDLEKEPGPYRERKAHRLHQSWVSAAAGYIKGAPFPPADAERFAALQLARAQANDLQSKDEKSQASIY